MEQSKFDRAKEIKKELEKLNEQIQPLVSSDTKVRLNVSGAGFDRYLTYSSGHMPQDFEETLKEDLEYLKDKLLKKFEKRIKALEKEFDSL